MHLRLINSLRNNIILILSILFMSCLRMTLITFRVAATSSLVMVLLTLATEKCIFSLVKSVPINEFHLQSSQYYHHNCFEKTLPMQVVNTPPHVCVSSPPHVYRTSNGINSHMNSGVDEPVEIPRFLCDGDSAADLEEQRYQNLVKAISERDNDDLHRHIDTNSSSLGLPNWIVEGPEHCRSSSLQRDSLTSESSFLDQDLPEFRRILPNMHDSDHFRDDVLDTNNEIGNSRLDWSSKYLGPGSIFSDTSPQASYDGFRPRPRYASSAYHQDDEEMIYATPEQPVLGSHNKGVDDAPFRLDYRSSIRHFKSDDSCFEEEQIWMKLLDSISTPEISSNSTINESSLSCDDTSLESFHTATCSHLPLEAQEESAADTRTSSKEYKSNSDHDPVHTVVHRTPPHVVEPKSLAESAKSVIKMKDRPYNTLLQDPTLIKRQRLVSFNDHELSDIWPANSEFRFRNNLSATQEDIDESTDSSELSVPTVSRCTSAVSYFQHCSIEPEHAETSADECKSNLFINVHNTPISSEQDTDITVTATAATENKGHNISYNFSSPDVTLKTPRSPFPVRYTKPTAIRLGMDIGSSSMSQNIYVQKYHEMLHSIHNHSVRDPPSLPPRRSFSEDTNIPNHFGLALSKGSEFPSLGVLEDYQTEELPFMG